MGVGVIVVGGVIVVLAFLGRKKRRRRRLPEARVEAIVERIVYAGREWSADELRQFILDTWGPASVSDIVGLVRNGELTVAELEALLHAMRLVGLEDSDVWRKVAAAIAELEPLLDPYAEDRAAADILALEEAAEEAEASGNPNEQIEAETALAVVRAVEEARQVAAQSASQIVTVVEQPATTSATSAPSVAGYDPAKARELAPVLDRELRKLGSGTRDERSRRQTNATLQALEAFARAAFGDAVVDAEKARNRTRLQPDGYWAYGGTTRGALVYYGISNPPATLVRPYETIPYSPPIAEAA